MQANTGKSVLSPDVLVAIRSNREAEDLRVDTARQLRACEEAGDRIAQCAQRQLDACGMSRAVDWTKHRSLVIGYVFGMSDSSTVARWSVALTCLAALSQLLGDDSEEGALCLEGQQLREKGHPGYLTGVKAAGEDRATLQQGKTPTALARILIDREMQYR